MRALTLMQAQKTELAYFGDTYLTSITAKVLSVEVREHSHTRRYPRLRRLIRPHVSLHIRNSTYNPFISSHSAMCRAYPSLSPISLPATLSSPTSSSSSSRSQRATVRNRQLCVLTARWHIQLEAVNPQTRDASSPPARLGRRRRSPFTT